MQLIVFLHLFAMKTVR